MATVHEIEVELVSALIADAVAAGYSIRVYDGGAFVTPVTTDAEVILDAMFSVDEETLYFYKDGKRAGWASMVYGNDGYDVIADYHAKMEHIMVGVNAVSDRYANAE